MARAQKNIRTDSRTVFIDASLFAIDKPSGIAYAVTNITHALVVNSRERTFILITTTDVKVIPERLRKLPNLRIKRLPISSRILRLLARFSILPPLDLFLGKGVYIFPNYYNFPVPFSKSITFVHDVSFLIYPETVQTKNLKFLVNNIEKWIKRTNVVSTLSEASKGEMIKTLGITPDKAIVTKVPIDESFKRCSDEQVSSVTERYGLPQKYLLYLGNIEPRKNLERLVRAFIHTTFAKEGGSLLLVGADKWKASGVEHAIEEARKSGVSIAFPTSFVDDDDLPALISGASFLVQPSIHEGFGVPPTQAIACGTPVLVSDLPVMHEVLGSSARYFNPYDEGDITRQIDDMSSLVADEEFINGQQKEYVKTLDMLRPHIVVKSLTEATV